MSHSKSSPSKDVGDRSARPEYGFVESELRVDSAQMRHTFPQFIDALTDAVLIVDRHRRVVAANRRYMEVFGSAEPRVVGSMCQESLNCPDGEFPGNDANDGTAQDSQGESGRLSNLAGGGHCMACQVIDFREPRRVLRSVPDAEGRLRRWEATLNPVVDEQGEVTHVVEVWRDITDRNQLEGQLAHSERLASLGILAAGVAHEINNPMASIEAGVESLRRWMDRLPHLERETEGEANEVLTLLEDAVTRCVETTNKLMLLAQPYEIAPTWVDLNRAARDTLSLLAYISRNHGVKSREDLDPELPLIWAKESAIRSVCMNLCLNAVQAMKGGGELLVRTRRHGVDVRMEVIDNGPGIATSDLSRIWDPFFTTKPVGQGTGLGLSITHQVVRRHGGDISVESRPAEGARFIVTLPVAGLGGDDG
jgi:signal transduction histidine kinase